MTVADPDRRLVLGAVALVDRAVELAREYDEEVQHVVRDAADRHLDDVERERLFIRIVGILLNDGREPDEVTKTRLAQDIRREVAELMAASQKDALGSAVGVRAHRGVQLVERYGLVPKDVVPVPTFKGLPVAMREGYVDVTTINLWKGNHRVELFVEEFTQREGREPEDAELLSILNGDLVVGGVDKDDPFKIRPLARSVADKGVERPPILTSDGEPKDGNRRLAAAKYVLTHKGFTEQERERARWVRVWVAAPTTEDVIEAIVVALNFEDDHKQKWEEYVKARLVVGRYRSAVETHQGRMTEMLDRRFRQDVADYYAISTSDVGRYIKMVRWADDFEAYHVEDKGRAQAQVRYKANDIFQWFYEIQAGRTGTKLTEQLDRDDDLKAIVYDLMFDVLESGAQVRSLHKVVADEAALKTLIQAHEESGDPDEAQKLVTAAIAEAAKNAPTRKVGFEQFIKSAVDRLDGASPKLWQSVDSALLRDLRRVLPGAIGAVEGELRDRSVPVGGS